MEKVKNEKLGEFANRQPLKQTNFKELLIDYGAVSLYPSAMWDKKTIYPKIETRYAFSEDMNDELVNKMIHQSSTQGIATLLIMYHTPKTSIVQHLPTKKAVIKNGVYRMRSGYILDTLTSVCFREIVKIRCTVIGIYECVFCRKNFKVSPFRKVDEKLFAS